MLGCVFQVVIEAGNKAQIIPAILIVYVYAAFSQINENLRNHRTLISIVMAIIFIVQIFVVKEKLLTIIVDNSCGNCFSIGISC